MKTTWVYPFPIKILHALEKRSSNLSHLEISLDLITRILHHLTPHKILLDTPHTNKPAQQILTPRLIVRTTRSRASERLLPHYCSCALTIDVEIPS